MNKCVLSLTVSESGFNFSSRKNKQILIAFNLQHKLSFKDKQAKTSFI